MKHANQNQVKLLLHACCGPCSMEPVRLLRERGIEPSIFYANSNIHPDGEYEHRLDTIKEWSVREDLALAEGTYDPKRWEDVVGRIGDAARERFGVIAGNVLDDGALNAGAFGHGREAENARRARCRACYRIRFEEAARHASEHGFDALGTTLSVSPYQYTDVIEEELVRACEKAGVAALFEDYRPYYDNATKRSREEGLYRQNYCGCRFSDEEAAAERAERKRERVEKKAREAAEHAEERAAEERARREKKAERTAYDAKQARKRAILKQLREANRGETPAVPTDSAPSTPAAPANDSPSAPATPAHGAPTTPAASPNDDAKKEPTC